MKSIKLSVTRRPSWRAPRGFTLVECLVAGLLLTIVLALVAQLFVWDARERREAWRRQVAQQEASNVLERLAAQPVDGVQSDELERWKLSPEANSWLPDGSLRITASDVEVPIAGRRYLVEITYRYANGQTATPIRLTGWSFAPEVAP